MMLVNRSAPKKSELSTQMYNQHVSHLIHHLGFIFSMSLARDRVRSLEKDSGYRKVSVTVTYNFLGMK